MNSKNNTLSTYIKNNQKFELFQSPRRHLFPNSKKPPSKTSPINPQASPFILGSFFSLLVSIGKQVLSVIRRIIQKLISSQSVIFMNPNQSESFWKDLMRDDVQLRKRPREALPPNSPRTRHRHNNTQNNHRKVQGSLDSLQQQRMAKKNPPFEWTSRHEQQLFAMHRQLGNKWSTIAARLGAEDNTIKNKFYSTLRRGLRKLNKYIQTVRRSRSATHLAANKYLKAEMLVKVNAVADRTHEDKYEVKTPALLVSQVIQQGLIELAGTEIVYQENRDRLYPFEEELLGKIQEFNRNCKRRKGKRKVKKQVGDSSSSESPEEEDKKCVMQQERVVVADKLFGGSASTNDAPQTRSAMATRSLFKNQFIQQPQAQRQSLADDDQKEKILQGITTLLSREDTNSPGGFDVRLFESQEYLSMVKNRMLLEPSPASSFSSSFTQYFRVFNKNTLGMSGSYNYNPSLKQSMDISKSILERIPSLSKKYNAENALINSSVIRREIDNIEEKRTIWQKEEKEGSEKQ